MSKVILERVINSLNTTQIKSGDLLSKYRNICNEQNCNELDSRSYKQVIDKYFEKKRLNTGIILKINRENIWDWWRREVLYLSGVEANWNNTDSWAEEDTHKKCIIGLFYRLFKEKHGEDFYSDDKNHPLSSKDYFYAGILLKRFSSVSKVKDYMTWMFNNHKCIISIKYLVFNNSINKFNTIPLNNANKQRHDLLPDNFVDYCREVVPNIFNIAELTTYGHLNLIKNYINTYDNIEDEYKVVLIKAVELGLV